MEYRIRENEWGIVVDALVAELARLSGGQAARPWNGRAALVLLSGDLGAGKTTFVQNLARTLGVTETLQSPTFVIQKNYSLTLGERVGVRALLPTSYSLLTHIDAYRLNELRELTVLGFEHYLADPQNLILLEWPEQVPGIAEHPHISIRIEHDRDARKVTIS
ncbi:MAG: tRNA (adenosine(37)-N6)-threonylcarbamoyltransferase complex ATPase subunit type 1 TsaE [Candidatus Pacebacteria bacterium]|nr:tRNA (adenosine(37)-N6)-threonylcarbamoyltransferase complex ATPase subunit type 1 TsaE [Candidatus Paceibacterota bacterium]